MAGTKAEVDAIEAPIMIAEMTFILSVMLCVISCVVSS